MPENFGKLINGNDSSRPYFCPAHQVSGLLISFLILSLGFLSLVSHPLATLTSSLHQRAFLDLHAHPRGGAGWEAQIRPGERFLHTPRKPNHVSPSIF